MAVEATRAGATSRADRQARTRSALVATARELFLRDGYVSTSLERVAVEAGFSKGAVYSNFAHKDELCLAVLDDIHAEQVEAVTAAFVSERPFGERMAAFEQWAVANMGEQRWTALEVEFAARANHSTFVATALAQRYRSLRESLTALVADSARRYDLALAMDADDVATALLSLGIGLGAARANDSSLSVDVLTGTIRVLLGMPTR